MSSSHTSRFLGPILLWLNPDFSAEALARVQWIVRKGGHVFEYAVLSLLLWRALCWLGQGKSGGVAAGDQVERSKRWLWQPVLWTVAGCFLFAVSDEWHQSWVPSRGASFADVLLDTAGAVLGLVMMWSWGRWRKVW